MSALYQLLGERRRGIRTVSRGADITLFMMGDGLDCYGECAEKLAPFLPMGEKLKWIEESEFSKRKLAMIHVEPAHAADTIARATAQHSVAVTEYSGSSQGPKYYCVIYHAAKAEKAPVKKDKAALLASLMDDTPKKKTFTDLFS